MIGMQREGSMKVYFFVKVVLSSGKVGLRSASTAWCEFPPSA